MLLLNSRADETSNAYPINLHAYGHSDDMLVLALLLPANRSSKERLAMNAYAATTMGDTMHI